MVARRDCLAGDVVLQEQLPVAVWRLGGEVFSAAAAEADLRDLAGDPAASWSERFSSRQGSTSGPDHAAAAHAWRGSRSASR